MERKLGEIFEYNNKWYKVVTSESCANCAFLTISDGCSAEVSGRCYSSGRMDGVSVHFEEVPAPVASKTMTISPYRKKLLLII